jgi:hypothetical protein
MSPRRLPVCTAAIGLLLAPTMAVAWIAAAHSQSVQTSLPSRN